MKSFQSYYNGEDASAHSMFLLLSEILDGELVLDVHNAEPERPRIGRVVVADGSDWDPISAGVPRIVWYNGTAWKALDA